MDKPTDQQVEAYIKSVPGLRGEWGIPRARRTAGFAFAIMSICLIAIAAGAIVMYMMEEKALTFNDVSGVVIVLVLTYVACGLRFFQLRAERVDLIRYRKDLADGLTGDPSTDGETQMRISTNFVWKSLSYRTVERMLGIAGLVIITLNTYQSGELVFARMMLFDGAIIAFLAGAFWNNFALKADLLEVELEERSRATMKWQTEHPGEAQRQEDEAAAALMDEPVGKHSK